MNFLLFRKALKCFSPKASCVVRCGQMSFLSYRLVFKWISSSTPLWKSPPRFNRIDFRKHTVTEPRNLRKELFCVPNKMGLTGASSRQALWFRLYSIICLWHNALTLRGSSISTLSPVFVSQQWTGLTCSKIRQMCFMGLKSMLISTHSISVWYTTDRSISRFQKTDPYLPLHTIHQMHKDI